MSLAEKLQTLQPEEIESTRPERHLRAVTKPAKVRKPRVMYAMTAVIGAVLIAGAQMGLSLATTATTYDIRDLNAQQRDLTVQSQVLQEKIVGLSSPQYLAANATASGMVIGASPTYLRLSDGAIVGTGEVPVTSTVNVLSTPAVGNALIADTPLATSPSATIGGAIPVTTTDAGGDPGAAVVEEPVLPPVITEGLPVPETH